MPEVRIPKQAVTRFDLPPVCVATGATEGVSFQKTSFTYVPVWARMSLAFCGIVGVVLMMLNTKRVQAELPFTDAAFAAWKRSKLVAAGIIIGSLLPLAIALMLPREMMIWLVVFVAMVVGAVVYSVAVAKKLGPACKEIDDESILLVIPNDDAARAIEQRLGLGAPAYATASPGADEYEQRLQAELDRM